MEKLREILALKGIYPAPSEKIMYRYSYEDILIDFIPFEETPLGPTNSWLKPGFEEAYPVSIGEIKIKILPVSLFLATKWEAFISRGTDPRTSHDFEDIIYVLDNRTTIVDEIEIDFPEIKQFLKEEFKRIYTDLSFEEIITCHIHPLIQEERWPLIKEKIEQIIDV